MFKKFNLLFVTFFYIGKIKYFPGTFASLATCLVFLLLISIFNFSVIFLITLTIFCYSFLAINNSFDEFESEDPQEIIIDEHDIIKEFLEFISTPYNVLLCFCIYII